MSDEVLLHYPEANDGYALMTDASGEALFQVLRQEFGLLEFASKRLTKAEIKWNTTEREAFAIKWPASHFVDYLKATVTDHQVQSSRKTVEGV